MKNAEFFAAINDLCEDRGLEKEKVLAAIERGVINAYKKETGISNIRLDFNEEESEYNFFEYYNVVNDDELDESDPSKVTLKEARKHKKTAKIGDYFEIKRNVNLKEFGRLSINTTKQMLNQSIKQLEREKSYEFFSQHPTSYVISTIPYSSVIWTVCFSPFLVNLTSLSFSNFTGGSKEVEPLNQIKFSLYSSGLIDWFLVRLKAI